MYRELKLELGFDNVIRNWPQGCKTLSILEYCEIIELLIVKSCTLECKQYLQHFIEFRNQQLETIDVSEVGFYQEITSFIAEYIDDLENNPEPGGSNELWWYYIDDDKNLLEIFNLDIAFCSAHFIYHLNRYFLYPNYHPNVTVSEVYTCLCNGLINQHNKKDYSTLLKSWLMLIRIVDKKPIDTLTRKQAKDLFEELFDTMINDIGELNYTAVYYHYLVHYWKDVFNMVLDYLVSDDDEILVKELKVLRKSLNYLVLIRNATKQYKEVIQFNYNDCGYGEYNLRLILKDVKASVNQPIFEDNHMERYWLGMGVDWSLDDLNHEEKRLYDEFLNNKLTDNLVQFIQSLKSDLKYIAVIERRKSEVNLLDKLTKDYKFNGFLHFTDFSNLNGILKHGKLLSRAASSKLIKVDAAEQSVINRTEETIKHHVRFYYKEKTPTLWTNEGIKQNNMHPHMPLPVMLTFSEKLIFRHDKLFLDGGGGSSNTRSTENAKLAMNFRWDQIFYRGPIPNGNNTLTSVYGETDGHVLTNKKNAEFLCFNEVSIDYIDKITFRSPSDMKMFENLGIVTDNIELLVDKTKFNLKESCDFLYDFELNIERDGLYLGYIFYRYNGNFKYTLQLFGGNEEIVIFDLKNDKSHGGVYRLEIPIKLANYDFYCKVENSLFNMIDRIVLMIDDVCCMTWRKSND